MTGLIASWWVVCLSGTNTAGSRRRIWHEALEALLMRSPVGVGHLLFFVRQLILLKGEGLTLGEALDVSRQHTVHPGLRVIISRLQRDVLCGVPLHESLTRHPRCFSPYFISMVRLGEQTGRLYITLNRLADTLENELRARRDVGVIALYPIVVAFIGIAVLLLLLLFIIPQFAAFYSDFSGGEAQLPALTRKVIELSDFIGRYWQLIPFWLCLPLLLQWLRRTLPVRSVLDPLLLRIPYFCWFTRKTAVAAYFFSAGTALRAGFTPQQALEQAQSCVDNLSMRRALRRLAAGLAGGRDIAFALRHALLLPPDARHMLAASVEAGRLDYMLLALSADYQRELRRVVRILICLVEPALILIIGAVVFIVVVSLYLPIFNLVDVIK